MTHRSPYAETSGISWSFFPCDQGCPITGQLDPISSDWDTEKLKHPDPYWEFCICSFSSSTAGNYVNVDQIIKLSAGYTTQWGKHSFLNEFNWNHVQGAFLEGFLDIYTHLWWKLNQLTASVSVFLGLSSCFWCTSWLTWEICAMALLWSSLVRNWYHNWKYGID